MLLLSYLKKGYNYMKIWPTKNELDVIFIENKVINVTTFALFASPIIVLVSVFVCYFFYDNVLSSLIISQLLFVLSLPLQGLLWLGHRSQQPLPLSLVHWCHTIKEKMIIAGYYVQCFSCRNPTYQDMAILLHFIAKNTDMHDVFDLN